MCGILFMFLIQLDKKPLDNSTMTESDSYSVHHSTICNLTRPQNYGMSVDRAINLDLQLL